VTAFIAAERLYIKNCADIEETSSWGRLTQNVEGRLMQKYRINRRGARVLTAVTLIAVVLFAATSTNTVNAETINIAWTGEYWSTLPFRVAIEKGFFAKEGLQARLITMRTAIVPPALMQGELDYTAGVPAAAGLALRGLPLKIVGIVTQGVGAAIISKPEIGSIERLKGKKIAINSIGDSSDYTIYTYLAKRGFDPNRDVTVLTVGGTSARFAALMAGTVDATAVSSPYEYKAEQAGLRTLVSFKETAEYVKLPLSGLVVTQDKLAKDGAQVVRVLKALRGSTLFIREQRIASIELLARSLNLERVIAEKFYPIYRDQYNPELTVPDSVLEEYRNVATFRLKEKDKTTELLKIQYLRDWTFAEKAKY
jgi:ABC-type nitrate/sulfonate/bicarbonate transport system substrate-binding protein